MVGEDSAVATVCLVLRDILDGLERDVLVDLTTAPGTADNGTDFGPVSVELVFSSSSMRGEAICRDINITNDLFVESDETFTVGLMLVDSNDMVGGTNPPVTVTIQDNDGK